MAQDFALAWKPAQQSLAKPTPFEYTSNRRSITRERGPSGWWRDRDPRIPAQEVQLPVALPRKILGRVHTGRRRAANGRDRRLPRRLRRRNAAPLRKPDHLLHGRSLAASLQLEQAGKPRRRGSRAIFRGSQSQDGFCRE